MAFMPQLCDLALSEPMGDPALKQLLIQIGLASYTDAMAISFFIRCSQEAVYMCVCVYIYIYMYICIYIDTYIHTCIHTNI